MANPSTFITDGVKTVATAGTQETLVSGSTPCNEVIIQALATNASDVFIGGSTIAAGRGVALGAGEVLTLGLDDAFKVWVDVTVNGQGVSYITLGGT